MKTILLEFKDGRGIILYSGVEESEDEIKINGYVVDTIHSNNEKIEIGDKLYFRINKVKTENLLTGGGVVYSHNAIKRFMILDSDDYNEIEIIGIKKKNVLLRMLTLPYKVTIKINEEEKTISCWVGLEDKERLKNSIKGKLGLDDVYYFKSFEDMKIEREGYPNDKGDLNDIAQKSDKL